MIQKHFGHTVKFVGPFVGDLGKFGEQVLQSIPAFFRHRERREVFEIDGAVVICFGRIAAQMLHQFDEARPRGNIVTRIRSITYCKIRFKGVGCIEIFVF